MKPRKKIATAPAPGGGEICLYQHDRDFSMQIENHELMNSRQHESELDLARLGCAHLADRRDPSVLIGGLGMGYTLRQALDMLGPGAHVTVCELSSHVIEWNRKFFGEINGHPLADKRVEIKTGDVVELISNSQSAFDAILLDIDNGPSPSARSGNRQLYGRGGMLACRRALRKRACLAVWSIEPCKQFERVLMACGLYVRRYRAPAYKGGKSLSRYVWVASERMEHLPPGGGEPLPPARNEPQANRRPPRRRR